MTQCLGVYHIIIWQCIKEFFQLFDRYTFDIPEIPPFLIVTRFNHHGITPESINSIYSLGVMWYLQLVSKYPPNLHASDSHSINAHSLHGLICLSSTSGIILSLHNQTDFDTHAWSDDIYTVLYSAISGSYKPFCRMQN